MDTMPHTRRHAVDGMRRELLRRGWPRLEMLLLVTLTGGAGFVVSFLLLRFGVSDMWLRYPLAVAAAYGVFLGLLWLWLHTRTSDWSDGVDVSPDIGASAGGWSGGGGRSGGAGASASYDSPSIEDGVLDTVADPVGKAIGSVADADEAAIPLAAIILVGAVVAVLVLSSLFVVWSAPVLFAELLVDSLLAAGLYRPAASRPTAALVGNRRAPHMAAIPAHAAAGGGRGLGHGEVRPRRALAGRSGRARGRQGPMTAARSCGAESTTSVQTR